jgi:hypothetical protein
MRLDNIIRSFIIASFVSFIVLLMEAAYYGINSGSAYGTTYSITAPFVNNFSDLGSFMNITILVILFISTFVIVSNMISKNNKQNDRYKVR